MADIDELLLEDEPTEDDESDDESIREDDEAFPFAPLPFFGSQPRPPSVAPNRNYYTPRMNPFVTQPQFASALRNIRSDVSKNSAAIKTVSARVTAEQRLNVRQNRALIRQNKTNIRQEKEIAALKKGLKKASDMSLLMMLLSKPKMLGPTTSVENVGGIDIPIGSSLPYETGTGNSLLLMMLLMGGLGGGGNGDSDNNMLLGMALMGGMGGL